MCSHCDVCRFGEASHLAGASVSQPDWQPVVRLLLYVPQMGMKSLYRPQSDWPSCHIFGPEGHSALPPKHHPSDSPLSLNTDVSTFLKRYDVLQTTRFSQMLREF